MGKKESQELDEKLLSRWKLIEQFNKRLQKAQKGRPLSRTHRDHRRKLTQKDYLCLILFSLFNPVVESMRGLCKASHLKRVQEAICEHPVSLGSFSQCQQVIDPELLERVFKDLAKENTSEQWGDKRLKDYRKKLVAIDSTLWKVVPRMGWALWRNQHTAQSAIRLHVRFRLLEQKPVGAAVHAAKKCERAVLRQELEAGDFYVGDRNYGEDYALFSELEAKQCAFIIRLRKDAVVHVQKELALSKEDKAAGVVRDQIVRLGHRKQSAEYRLVTIEREGEEPLRLLTNKREAQELGADLVGLIYKYRWQVELFFKWIKCILGVRHWMAESPQGIAIQVYCVLIAALLLFRASGKMPNKRAMEMIRFYFLGYADLEELCQQLKLDKG